MSKYLIVSKEGDFISSSRSAKKHILNTEGKNIMVYDKDGILINIAEKDVSGNVIVHGNKFYDGEPRQWVIDFVKNNKVGTMVKDAHTV